MIKRCFSAGIITLTLLHSVTTADTTVVSTALGISAYLPDNWIAVEEGDTGIFFTDTTFVYRSCIYCKKHPLNTTDYPSATDWTRAHFIAYLLVVQYSYDPFGAVLYFDSSATCTQDSLWAPEAFSEFYSIEDTLLGAWNEYMRYTESGSYGYEIYAIGDTTDMKENIELYMGIINLVKLREINYAGIVPRTLPRISPAVTRPGIASGLFDLLGKKRGVESCLANGVYYRTETGSIRLKVQ